MRWYLRWFMVGLIAAGCSLPASAADKAAPGKGSAAATCGDYGTSIHFEKTPKDAAKKALKEEKLVFVVHVSGLFEESDFT